MIFFGALITGCTEYRATYYQAWAEASKHLSVLFGATMTFPAAFEQLHHGPGVHFARLAGEFGSRLERLIHDRAAEDTEKTRVFSLRPPRLCGE